VYYVRYANKILVDRRNKSTSSAAPERRGDGRYSTKAVARLLNVSTTMVTRWCRSGKLDSIQGVAFGLHWIRLTPEIIAELRKPVQQHRG
jgi:hypothetical protein